MSIDIIITCATIALAVIAFIVTFVRTGSLKKSFKEFENVVKYRSPDYRLDKEVNDVVDSQSFTNERTEYKLNKHTNELEVNPVKTDLAELIQSSVETALDRVLTRLFPEVDEVPDTVEADYDTSIDDLNDLAVAMDIAEDYREKLGLSLETPVSEIYKKVSEYSDKLKQQIIEKSKKEPVKNVETSQKETDPEGK